MTLPDRAAEAPSLIDPGQLAPEFTLQDQRATSFALADVLASGAGGHGPGGLPARPHHLLAFFYPKDGSASCTAEAAAFDAASEELAARGVAVCGISPGGVAAKRRAAERAGLRIPLLADDTVDDLGRPAVCARFGVWVEKLMYGRRGMGVARTTYLIAPDRRVVHRWDLVRVPGHVDQVLSLIRERPGA